MEDCAPVGRGSRHRRGGFAGVGKGRDAIQAIEDRVMDQIESGEAVELLVDLINAPGSAHAGDCSNPRNGDGQDRTILSSHL